MMGKTGNRAARKALAAARRAHNKRDWAAAREAYEAVLAEGPDERVAAEVRGALELVEQELTPPGYSGFRAALMFALAPVMTFLPGVIPGLENIGAVVVIFIIAAVVLFIAGIGSSWKAIFRERGLLNRLVGMAALCVVAYVVYFSLDYDDQKRKRYMIHEGMAIAGAAKVGVAEYYVEHGELPSTNAEAGVADAMELSDQNVRSVAVGPEGVITITFEREPVSGETLVIRPLPDSDGLIRWDCADGTVDRRMRPSQCRKPLPR